MCLVYWYTSFSTGSIHKNDYHDYVDPLFLYILPPLALLIDFCINRISFDYFKVVFLIAVYVIYCPLTYIGNFVLGYYPYSFIDFEDFRSFVYLGILGSF